VALPSAVAVAVALLLAALSSRASDWEPLSLVLALGALAVCAEAATIGARSVRVSSGLAVAVPIMALLGPAPAVAIAIASLAVESVINRISWRATLSNAVIFTWVGLVGGMLFRLLGEATGLDRDDTAYAALVPPIYCVVAVLNIVLMAATGPPLSWSERRALLRDSALPTVPWEAVCCVIATAAVLVWAEAGMTAVAVLLGLLLVTIPLLRALEAAIRSGDDRARLLSEVLNAEERERARLAEALHDGPMQRLLVLRQDIGEGVPAGSGEIVAGLDATIAEARAIVSALHPATVRELGFEGSLRAAVAPFVGGRAIELDVEGEVEDGALVGALLLPIARELVVNAVKHAEPTRIGVSVSTTPAAIVLEVADDGIGIDPIASGRAVRAGHLGLAAVRRRVEDAGGRFEMAIGPDGGTRSRVSVARVSG
jgi:signal transduction histidine kinase